MIRPTRHRTCGRASPLAQIAPLFHSRRNAISLRVVQILQRYLSQQPRGVESHPDLLCKGSLIRFMLAENRLPPAVVRDLPTALREHCTSLPLVSSWYPEVHLVGLMLAHLDAVFDGDEKRFEAWFYDLAKGLFDKPIYRFMMRLSSPERLSRGVAARWGAFHRGSSAVVRDRGPGYLTLLIDVPQLVYPASVEPTTAQAMLAVIDGCGGKQSRAVYDREPTGELRVSLSWR